MTINDIKSSDDLKKVLVDMEASAAEQKKAAEEKAAKFQAELAAVKASAKEDREKMEAALSKNWVEKFSTKDTKEETLYNMGKFINGLATKNGDTIRKFGIEKGGLHLNGMQEKEWEGGQTIPMQKATIGTPLTSDATTGSYLVPVEYAAEVMYVAKQASQLMGRVREVPMRGITKYVPTQNAAASCYWNTNQTSAKSEVNPTFSRATLTSQTMGIFTTLTEELDEDSLVPMAAYFRDIFGEAWGYEFDYQAGAANAAPFTGMLHGASNVVTMGAGSTSFDDVSADDLYDLISALTTENKRTGGTFFMHCTVLDKFKKLKDANGNYLWMQPYGNQPGTICGYPYVTVDAFTSSSAVSTKFVVFGNPKYYLFGNRVALEFKVFDQTYLAAQYDTIMFRCRARAAFTIGIAAAFASLRTAAS